MLSQEQRQSLDLATERYAGEVAHVLPFLERRGIGKDIALSRGLGFVADPIPEHKHARGRLAIPYITPSGTVAMTFRCIKEHSCKEVGHAKYMKPAGQEAVLYGTADAFKDTLDIHIAEGEMDAIVLSELCGLPSIGISGAKYWQVWWRLVLRDFRRVFIFCDGDDAGKSLGHKIVKELGLSAIPIHLPTGEDVNSMYLKYGAERLRELAK